MISENDIVMSLCLPKVNVAQSVIPDTRVQKLCLTYNVQAKPAKRYN